MAECLLDAAAWKMDAFVMKTVLDYENVCLERKYPDFGYEMDNDEEQVTLDKNKQNLRVSIDKKNRGGKVVTLITGFIGTENDLKELGKLLKSKCGVGGSAKDGEIMVQGDFKTKIIELLIKEGYSKTKGIGG